VTLENGCSASASVPSGASKGEKEALELRDRDPARYGGKGVLKAIRNINQEISPKLIGMDATRQAEIDGLMLYLDGTPFKQNLGANAILGISMAIAAVAAQSVDLPLYAYMGGLDSFLLPVPMMNIINGGEHADNSVDLQEFMIVPLGAPNFTEALRYGAETFHALKKILRSKGYVTNVGDEGGFAPNLQSNEEACELIVEAIEKAGYRPGVEISIALDAAASSFSEKNSYNLAKSGQGQKSREEMIALYIKWCNQYPIVSLEDPMDEHDWDGFCQITKEIGDEIQIVGDDLYVTNKEFVKKGIEKQASTAVLIKLNQIGNVTETIETINLCRKAGWNYVVSHRSGDTEDTFIADFCVAMGGGQIKSGSLSRSERLAKYNRLIEIEAALGKSAVFGW
jgi:enolase